MTKVISPITGTENVVKVRSVNTRKLIDGYKKAFSIDITAYIKSKDVCVYQCLDSDFLFYEPRSAAGNGEFYKELSRFEWYYEDNKWEFEQALRLITANDRVLEIGSGKGAFLKKASKIAKEAIGLELNEDAVAVAKSKGLTVEKKAVEDYVGENGVFDIVCSFQVMEHVADVKGILKASIELLAPNGKLIISVPNNSAYLKNLDYAFLNMPPHHLNLWTEDTFKSLSKLYEIRLDNLFFDDLEEKHVAGFYASIAAEIYKSKIKRLILNRFFGKQLKDGIKSLRQSIKGHTIIAVYTKL